MGQPALEPPRPPPRRLPRPLVWLARLAMVIAGLGIGLVVAELVVAHRDGDAFPHVNFYVADAKLGVRLEPDATEKIAFGGNPITTLHTNSLGYRGADWPAATDDAILVVGDSQVFGLGVEDTQTFSARLAETLHRPVLNAGVPTYGPAEYRAIIEEVLAQRHPKTVVLTLNLVNDLFELSHPNPERHVVWDGWAVRKENAPTTAAASFPGRAWLFRNSHLLFAIRKWRHHGDPVGEAGLQSEGSWKDVLVAGEGIAKARGERVAELQSAQELRRAAVVAVKTSDAVIDDVLQSELTDRLYANEGPEGQAASANAGDIVHDSYGEESRSVVVTAEIIRRAVIVRAKLRAELATWASKHTTKAARDAAAALDARDKAMQVLSNLDPGQLDRVLEPPLGAYIRDVAALCQQHGARLVVAILPIDVQVSATEWAKYGVTPVAMEGTQVLAQELVAAAAAIGVSALDATAPLAAAEPGAFLNRDIHMTAKGHAAVAAALATVITAPPPVILRVRTLVPVPEVFRVATETTVKGSTAAGCETKRVGEWLRVLCGRTEAGDDPTDVKVLSDASHESLVMAQYHATSLVTPINEGRSVVVQFAWADHTRDLTVDWPAGAAKPVIAFGDAVKVAGSRPNRSGINEYGDYDQYDDPPVFKSPVERAICDCWNQTFGGVRDGEGDQVRFWCSGAYGAADAACTRTYAASCARMLECTRRDPASPPQ